MKICKKEPSGIRLPKTLPINSMYEIDNNPRNKKQLFGRKVSMKPGPGHTANVTYYPNSGHITKEFIRYHEYNIYEREVFWLLYLKHRGYSWCPKIFYHDDAKKIIYMTYVGERISKKNAPHNWQEQLKSILKDLQSEEITHNDIKWEDILVHNGKLKLIDYGWMCWKGDLSCDGRFNGDEKPGEVFPDNLSLVRIGSYLNSTSLN